MPEQQTLQPEFDTIDLHNCPRLGDDDLHIWRIPLKLNKGQIAETLTYLNPHQLDKYNRRKTEQAKCYYLAGRYYLFKLLAQYKQCEPTQISLQYNRLNKPSLADNSQRIEFNYTDTLFSQQALGVFAFSKNQQLGVDLEAKQRLADYHKIMHKRFTQAEIEYVLQHPKNTPAERFLDIWTRKEAYGKALGKGINFAMNQVNLIGEQCINEWMVQPIDMMEYQACVVYQGRQAKQIRLFELAC